jgi:hypothetical protein
MIYIIENLFWSTICAGLLFGMFMVVDKISQIPVCKGKTQWTLLQN